MIKTLNELEIIKNIKNLTSANGIGDDAYILSLENTNLLISTDAFYENIHFKHSWFSPEELGERFAMAAISDIAAMGGNFKYLFNTISYNDKKTIHAVLKGINNVLKKTGGILAGGDLTGGVNLSVSITVVGEAKSPMKRSTAKKTDNFFVTNYLGEAAIGLWCLENDVHTDESKYFIDKFKKTTAKLEKGKLIAEKANSLIDTSDGLFNDLSHIVKASDIGVNIEQLPVSEKLINFCYKYNLQWEDFVLYGGEDFELIYSAPDRILDTDLFLGMASNEKVLCQYKELSNKSFKHF